MKIAKLIGAVCALGLAIAAPVQSASAQTEAWTLARAQNGSFSIETPCTPTEIDAIAERGAKAFESLNFVTGTQIVCQKGALLIVAGIVDFDDMPAGTSSIFDQLSSGMGKGNGMAGKPEVTTFLGRRALVNRKEKDGFLAQVTVVELSPTRVLMLTAAYRDTNLSIAAQGQTLDRFYASVKVTGQ